ncbi:uncharacterized protein BCR38DRAFT_346272 [Pseudomassariella vexata]|uniref:GDP-fucose protein O-fucosyltransferase n=1 Tax=Pseudomassariella vexata TaxID=1141098 RepID=A0A1Y2DUG2_9PEZI|nr:uncharacterized protein BCR38DRAFT_346272 [Pseudomassariella vexata]ORY62275.1 hypothetical protein BCR38DRAFT_346272 [Pseudomassariella vexata]
MLGSSRVFSILKIIAVLVLFSWSLSYFGITRAHYERVLRQFKGERAHFVADFLENDFDGPFDGKQIALLCANRTWTEGLIFHCDPPAGGIAVVRNAHLNCIRMAIEAGAELIVPEIVRRNAKDITQVTPDSKGKPRGIASDYFYDHQHFNWSMSTFCPQMRLYWSVDELFDTPMGTPLSISIGNLDMPQVEGSIIEKPGTFAIQFKKYLDSQSNPKTRTWPFKVEVAVTLDAWPTTYDAPAFVRNFGRVLRFRDDTRQLAAAAYFNMKKKKLTSPGFVGIHLRTEEDVWGTEFPPYDEQADYYLNYVVQSKYSVVYLASGATSENITAFTERARDLNVTVVTKKGLLDPEDILYLEHLTWDQQALVDYELILRSNLMAGTCESFFAWSLAMRRAASIGSVGGHTVVPPSSTTRWQDTLSAIMGSDQGKNKNMQLAIWP